MSTLKHHRHSKLLNRKKFATIETPITSISQTTENHLNNFDHQESSQINQLIDFQEQPNGFHHDKSKLIHDHFTILTKSKNKRTTIKRTKTILDKTPSNNEDDWVCPVAVVLRRAGYNVPLRPSKSWLERDRKKQALLRKQQTSSKEI